MIAALHGKNSAGTGEFSLFNVLHPGTIYADRQLVLLFARNGASVTSNALAIVDNEAVLHKKISPRKTPGTQRKILKLLFVIPGSPW